MKLHTEWKGQIDKICDMHEIMLPYEEVKWLKFVTCTNLPMCSEDKWHMNVFWGQMTYDNMHKITHAFECGKHVNIMGPNKWN